MIVWINGAFGSDEEGGVVVEQRGPVVPAEAQRPATSAPTTMAPSNADAFAGPPPHHRPAMPAVGVEVADRGIDGVRYVARSRNTSPTR